MVTGTWLMWTCSLVTIQLNSISLLESKTPKYTTGTANVRMHLHLGRFATMLYCWVGQTASVIAASPWLLFELRYIVMTTEATTIWVAGQARPARRWNVSSASGQKETFPRCWTRSKRGTLAVLADKALVAGQNLFRLFVTTCCSHHLLLSLKPVTLNRDVLAVRQHQFELTCILKCHFTSLICVDTTHTTMLV